MDFSEATWDNPKSADAYRNGAWLLATCPEAHLRDGIKAVDYATKACDATQWKDPDCLGTLAAAYADAGDFKQAVKWETQYGATPGLSQDQTTRSEQRLALYQDGKPYHEEPKSPQAPSGDQHTQGEVAGYGEPPHPQTESEPLQKGDEALAKHDYNLAILSYSEAITADSKNVAAYVARAKTYYAKGDRDSALSRRSIKVASDRSRIRHGIQYPRRNQAGKRRHGRSAG